MPYFWNLEFYFKILTGLRSKKHRACNIQYSELELYGFRGNKQTSKARDTDATVNTWYEKISKILKLVELF
jgi:hypothetical protein